MQKHFPTFMIGASSCKEKKSYMPKEYQLNNSFHFEQDEMFCPDNKTTNQIRIEGLFTK